MNIRIKVAALAAAVSLLSFAPALAQEEAAHVKPATAYVKKSIEPWLNDPVVIAADRQRSQEQAVRVPD